MDARLQLRVQRYGWDRAAGRYDASWRDPLAVAQRELLRKLQVRAGECVLDVACGTGHLACELGRLVGPAGKVVGVDLSQEMVDIATSRAREKALPHVAFTRMDAQSLAFDAASFDVVLCCFGLMYVPDAERALAEIRRVLRPGGRVGIAVWGERRHCAWSPVFSIVDEEVASEVCPLFFRLGAPGALASACVGAGIPVTWESRLSQSLRHRDADEACDAMFAAGPVALAWARFDALVRARVRDRYLAEIEPWRHEDDYELAAEFVVAVHDGGTRPPEVRRMTTTFVEAVGQVAALANRAKFLRTLGFQPLLSGRQAGVSTDSTRTMIMRRLLAGVVLAWVACVSGGAAAVALPAATFTVDCNSNNPFGDVTGGTSCALQGATASLGEQPAIGLLAQVTDPASVASQDASVTLRYAFEVVGGSVGDTVPLLIDTRLFTQAGPSAYAYASLYTDGSGADQTTDTACTDATCGATSFSGTLALQAQSGLARQVTLLVIAENTYESGGSALASADPWIRVDPSFANAVNYSVVVSEGIGNAPLVAVPEPSSAALALAGLGLMWVRRRLGWSC